MIRRISLKRLIDGGAAMFIQANINHIMDILGRTDSTPLVIAILRVWNISYLIFAMQNRAEELRPWAIIIPRLPYSPSLELDIAPATRIPMCPTEEYAISAFKSDCRRQISLVMIPPVSAVVIMIVDMK